MTTLRAATHDDLYQVISLAAAMHAESPRLSQIPLSKEKLMRLFTSLIDSSDGLLLVAERNGAIIGGIAAMVSEHWMSTERVATEFGIFLLPEHRGGMTAARIARAYIEWSMGKGVQPGRTLLGISTGVNQESTAALYKALGAKPASLGFEV